MRMSIGPSALGGFLDHILRAVRLVQVGAREMHVKSVLRQLFAGARQVRCIARNDRDLRAFGCERLRACEADALAAARDQHDLPGKSEVHEVTPYRG